ncbi:NPCBM/NEW2 domain-containing protein [Haladaptatus sp. CMAA 1911]
MLSETRRTILKGIGAFGAVSVITNEFDQVSAYETNDHLAQTPPMGWNSWNQFACDISAELIKETADAMVESGMREAGYEYINIDDCWMASERDDDGNLQPHPERFPNGIEGVAEYVHDKGLKLGIYSSAGTRTCQGLPASLGYEEQDARSYAEWGVDYLKYDNCYNQGVDPRDRYAAMGKALRKTDRDIVYSICCWGKYDIYKWGADVGGNLWRTTGDIKPVWNANDSAWYEGIVDIIDLNEPLAQYAGPGHWNDPDMLEVGVEVEGYPGLSDREARAHFSMWAFMAAPLLAGNDIRDMDETTQKILTNEDVIALNQDPAGVQGYRLTVDGKQEVWKKPLANGDVAVALFNRGDSTKTFGTTAEALDLEDSAGNSSGFVVDDLWTKETRFTRGPIKDSVPSHGVTLFRVRQGTPDDAPSAVTFDVDGGSDSIERGETRSVTVSLTNDGRTAVEDIELNLDAPDGWNVSPQSAVTFDNAAPGKSIETSWEVTAPEQIDQGEYEFTLHASYTWDDGAKTASTSTVWELETLPAPPTGETYLSDHEWVDATIGWGSIGLDESVNGNVLTIGEATYEKGIGTHAESEITYWLDGTMSQFVADVGVDDEVTGKGTVRFSIVGDGETLTETDVLTNGDDPVSLSVDVSSVDKLTLVVTDGGDNINYDHADWADAQVLE